jgi:hypothetical protein
MKKPRLSTGFSLRVLIADNGKLKAELRRHGVLLLEEAVLAEDGLAAFLNRTRLEGHLALAAALGAHRGVHLPRGEALVLALLAAVLAALGGAETTGVIKFLLTIREGEGTAAIAALELLVSHKKKKKE